MTDERKLELISASLDGELNSDERNELDDLLQDSAEARDLNAEFEQLDSLLRDVPEVEPPASLHDQIMAQVRPRTVKEKPSFKDILLDVLPGAGLKYVLATGAGAIMALLVIGGQPMDPGSIDYSDLVGTMSPDRAASGTDILDSYAFSGEGVESLIQLRLSGGMAFVALNISADFSAAGLWPEAVAQINGRTESIAIAGQAVQVQTSGQQQLTIFLRRADGTDYADEAEISLEITSDGGLLEQGELKAAW
jgi:anti-sigma factor RsiW